MAEVPHSDAEAQPGQLGLFEQIDIEAVKLAAIKRLTAYVSNKEVSQEDVPAALLFWESVLKSHARNAGRDIEEPEYKEVVDYFQASPFTSRLPELIKHEFHHFVGNIIQLGQNYEEAKKAYEAGQRGEEKTVELLPLPADEVVVVHPAPRYKPKPPKRTPPLAQTAPQQRPRLPKKPPAKKEASAAPAKPKPLRRIELQHSQSLRPFNPELYKEVELTGDLSRLNRYLKLPDEMLKAFALHIGLAELPDTQLPYSAALIRVVHAKAVGPALQVFRYKLTHHQETMFDLGDRDLVNLMVPERPDIISGMSFRDIYALASNNRLMSKVVIPAQDLPRKVRAIFETKIPALLDELNIK